MVKSVCINPALLSALSYCGHGDKILIASGNYPLETKSGDAEKLYLGVIKNVPGTTDILRAVLGTVNVERAEVMAPTEGAPEIFDEYSRLMPGMELETLSRTEFYEVCSRQDVRVAVTGGDIRPYANVLLTVSVVREEKGV